MRLCFVKLLVLIMLLFAGARIVSAGTVSGTVRNGTTGTVVPNQDVILIQLQGGMEGVATVRTDSQGRFTLTHSAVGAGPVLLRVPYQGVNYHQNVLPGQATADIEVFETTKDTRVLDVTSRMIVVQPDNAALVVGEEYSIHNHSNPPVTYNSNSGTFEFVIPDGAQLGQVSAWGAAGMPVEQGTIDKGKNHYAIAFPLRPADNGVRIAYQLPYPGNRATLHLTSPYAAQRVLVIAPPTMQISGDGFAPAGTEQGWNLFARENVPAGLAFELNVSGTAPTPSNPSGDDSTQASSGPALGVIPGRLESFRWPLIGGFATLFALGMFFLMKKQVQVVQPDAVEPAPVRAPAPSADLVSSVVSEAEREARRAMDDVKDALFRLELRRQAGTITETDYARERQRIEQRLREMMTGPARQPFGG